MWTKSLSSIGARAELVWRCWPMVDDVSFDRLLPHAEPAPWAGKTRVSAGRVRSGSRREGDRWRRGGRDDPRCPAVGRPPSPDGSTRRRPGTRRETGSRGSTGGRSTRPPPEAMVAQEGDEGNAHRGAVVAPGSRAGGASRGSAAHQDVVAHPLLEALVDLPLDPLERVVDRLDVPAEALADVLVGVGIDVQAEHVDLEAGEQVRHAPAGLVHALLADDLVGRVARRVRAEELVHRALPLVIGPRRRDRDVLVEGLLLVAGRRLDGGDDLPGDAQLGEGPEG